MTDTLNDSRSSKDTSSPLPRKKVRRSQDSQDINQSTEQVEPIIGVGENSITHSELILESKDENIDDDVIEDTVVDLTIGDNAINNMESLVHSKAGPSHELADNKLFITAPEAVATHRDNYLTHRLTNILQDNTEPLEQVVVKPPIEQVEPIVENLLVIQNVLKRRQRRRKYKMNLRKVAQQMVI